MQNPSLAADENLFGRQEAAGEAALMGIFYDLKQTQDRKPTGIQNQQYLKTVRDFLTSGWDEKALSRFYRSTKPLYLTQIFIPVISAAEGPKAFGVEKRVEANFYLIHYRGQVAAPKDGDYRFWGYGDNVCMVAVNGKLNLIGNLSDTSFSDLWKTSEPSRIPAGNGVLIAGDWMHLKGGEPQDLDILIGETFGGLSCFLMMVEEKGATYPMEGGHPVLPIFQLAPYDTPERSKQPKFSKGFPLWKGIQ